jgi:tyrosine-protein kinase Etk/Wzc
MHTTLEDILRTPSSKPNENQIVRKSVQLLQNWPWVLISVGLCLITALLYLRYATPLYEVTSTILVKDDTKGTDLGEEAIIENLGLSAGKSNVDNEVEILKSRTLMEHVVKDLQLFTTCFAKGNIKTTELFDQSPVQLHFADIPVLSPKQTLVTYTVRFFGKDSISITGKEKSWVVALGNKILLPEGLAVVEGNQKLPLNNNSYELTISGLDETVRKYSQALKVSATNKQVSIITLKLTDLNPSKGESILNQLIKNYLKISQTDKNRIAEQTLAFIDKNLDTVSREVTTLEQRMEQFRKGNQLTDLSDQSHLLLADLSQFDKENSKIQRQLSMVKSLLDFIDSNETETIPSSILLQQPVFLATLSKYNEIQLQRDKAKESLTNDHPVTQRLTQQLVGIRQELQEHINSRKAELDISYQSNQLKIQILKSQLQTIPGTERTFLDLKRQLLIKQDLHSFLLKKRMETSLSKSSTLPGGRVIDSPKANFQPVSPDKQITLLLALLTGIFIPIAFLTLHDIFNIRLNSREELTENVKAPLIGEISMAKVKPAEFGQSQPAEQFRTLRTNLQFVMSGQKSKVILITSGMSEEGKTYIATNLCHSLQLSGKKVILIDFDLRRPQIGKTLQLVGKGITDYAISDVAIDHFIQQPGQYNQFDVITAGTIPPNPAELIENQRIQVAITHLKQRYDYVVIDSPPFELVTDARLLSQYADLTLYVVRQNFTFRHQLDTIQQIFENNQLPKLHTILNNAKRPVPYGYTYGQK